MKTHKTMFSCGIEVDHMGQEWNVTRTTCVFCGKVLQESKYIYTTESNGAFWSNEFYSGTHNCEILKLKKHSLKI